MKKTLAVIMTVHNRRDTTVECIRRFYACKGLDQYEVEFYMMDDGCADGTAEAVRAKYPQVIILQGDGNLFWNRGMYYCWKEAIKKHHDYYLWLNDDTMLFENALEVLFEDYAKAGEMSIISGCCCDTATKSETTYGGWVNNRVAEMTGSIRPIEDMNGNVVLIPNHVVQMIGIIDPFFQHSTGDNEYGYRAQKNGIATVITSAFVASCDRHDRVSKSMDANLSLRDRLKCINSPWGARPKEIFYLYKKYKGLWPASKEVLRAYARCFIPKKSN